MFYSQERHKLRNLFYDTYQKQQNNQPLMGVEAIVWSVIKLHPEYLDVLENKDKYLNKEYLPEMGETNPFLHMSGHIGLREQVSTNRPKGISKIYQSLLDKHQGDVSEVEHKMMDCMMESLWLAQKNNELPDEKHYLKQLKKLVKS